MNTRLMKLVARAQLVLICTVAPVAMVHAQTGAAGGNQPATAGAGTTSGANYTQAQDNYRDRDGGSKWGWLGLLGLLGLLGMRRRDTHHVDVRDTTPSYETTGARRP